MKQHCNTCSRDLEDDKFAQLSSGGRRSVCKECQRAKSKNHYKNNKKYYFERNKARGKLVVKWLQDLKANTPCADCGRHFHFSAMHFDHLPEHQKFFNVGGMRMRTWRQIHEEVAKCEIVCTNCHALRTYNRSHQS